MKVACSAVGSVVEMLEGRMLMSGSPLGISQVAVGGGTELRIEGTGKSDRISLTQTSAGLVVANGGWSQTLSGQFQSIKIDGGSGNDSIVVGSSVQTDCTLYGGSGKNVLQAGSGDDTLVSIGSTADTLIGGSGNDSFWTDATPKEKILNLHTDEIAGGNVHRVGSFYTGTTPIKNHRSARKARAAAPLIEPATTDGSSYQDFSSHALFSSAGPTANDVEQGQVGDCYFLSVLSSVAKTDSSRIRQSLLDMGDGTYLVQFSRGSSNVFVRVDGQLPVVSNGTPDYAGLGAQGSIWVAIMEKAYTVFHGPTPSYASIDGGWMSQSYAALGASSSSLYDAPSAVGLLSIIQQQLSAGKSVTYATNDVEDGAPLIAGHAYSVDGVNLDASGNPESLRLRNPWGIDGAGNDGNNDGYVTITAQQAYDSMMGVVSAYV